MEKEKLLNEYYLRMSDGSNFFITNSYATWPIEDKCLGTAIYWQIYTDDTREHTVGWCNVNYYTNRFGDKSAYITYFEIQSEYRKKHYGQDFMKFIEKACRAQGIYKIELWTGKDNTIGQSFWKNNDYIDDKVHYTKYLK